MFGARYFPSRYFPKRYFGTGSAVIAPPPPSGPTYILLIDGTVVEPLFGWEIDAIVNGQSSFRFDVASADGSYRPQIDKEVFLYEDAILIFGGLITAPSEEGVLSEGGTPIITHVSALDFKVLTDRRFVNADIIAGNLKAALTVIVTYLSGISLDAGQVDGPLLNPLTFEDVSARDVLDQLSTLSGYVWDISYDKKLKMVAPGSAVAPYDVTVPDSIANGDVTVDIMRDSYANRIIARTSTLRSVTNNLAEQTAHDIWEAVITADDTTDQVGLDAIAAAYLLRSVVMKKRVTYDTFVRGLFPGQTQTIIVPDRNLNNTFFITELRTRRPDTGTYRTLTAYEGSAFQMDWRSVYRQWSGGGTPGVGTGAPSGAALQRPAYFLGGSGVDAVRSSIFDWVPASGGGAIGQGAIHVQVDTNARGTTDAKITGRMRSLDSGVTVQARLYDVSINAPVPGISPPVTGSTWTTVSWHVALNPGAHLYELQLISDTLDADVMATATLE